MILIPCKNKFIRTLARVAKEVKFYLSQPERGKFKQFNKLQIRLHFRGFSFVFHESLK